MLKYQAFKLLFHKLISIGEKCLYLKRSSVSRVMPIHLSRWVVCVPWEFWGAFRYHALALLSVRNCSTEVYDGTRDSSESTRTNSEPTNSIPRQHSYPSQDLGINGPHGGLANATSQSNISSATALRAALITVTLINHNIKKMPPSPSCGIVSLP